MQIIACVTDAVTVRDVLVHLGKAHRRGVWGLQNYRGLELGTKTRFDVAQVLAIGLQALCKLIPPGSADDELSASIPQSRQACPSVQSRAASPVSP